MARIPVLSSPAELTGEARRIAESIVDTRKSLDGPFSDWLHAPAWTERVAHLGTLVRFEGTLEKRIRTLAALVAGRHFQAQYVWGIQGVIGAERDIPRSTIDAIRDDRSEGIPPEDLQIIDFTRQLLRNNRVEEALAQAVLPLALRIMFIAYPIVTTIAFEAFPCHELDGGIGWLIADVAIDCDGDEHAAVQLVAWITIAVYPIGMWVLAAALLFKIRGVMAEGRESELRTAVAFLHKEYVPTAYWWELAEMLRRFILVGVLVVIAPGTITQSESPHLHLHLSRRAVLVESRAKQ